MSDSEVDIFDQQSHDVTEEILNLPWRGVGRKLFRCYLCGHRFKVGDYFRWQYVKGYANLLTCAECDTPFVVELWVTRNEEWDEMRTSDKFWWFNS